MPARFLALGDSYTIGEGVDAQARWPMRLAERLRARGIALSRPHFIARSGWTTDELSAAIDEELAQGQLSPPYGLVSLQIGVNDQYRGRDVAQFADAFVALLDRALGLAGGRATHVLAVSIPDWGVTPFARAGGRDAAQVAREIDVYNAAAADACAASAVRFVDVTDLTRDPALSVLLVDDGLHPAPGMYEAWAERLADAMPLPDADS